MSDTNTSYFSAAVEKLLAGKIICQYSDEAVFRYLNEEGSFEEVDRYLRKIRRALRRTSDERGIVCGYAAPVGLENKLAIRQVLDETINSMEALVRWLNLCGTATKTDRPVEAGDVIRESELLSAIEQAPVLVDDLASLCRTVLFQNNQSTSRGRLTSVLNKLREHGYLIPHGTVGTLYMATAKWSYLYDLMAFIRDHEQLQTDAKEHQQKELL